MSAKITLGSTLGALVLLIIIGVIVITGSKANEEAAKQAALDSAAAKAQTEQLNKTFTDFVDRWTERVKIGNTNTNNTQDLIVDTQKNILGNLSSHRVITNNTAEKVDESIKKLEQIINQTSALTGPEYEKLADKRVESIVGNLSEDHEIIFKALNISNTDETTDAENDTENLGQILKDFIQSQKDKPNEPQGSKVK